MYIHVFILDVINHDSFDTTNIYIYISMWSAIEKPIRLEH